MNSFVGAFYDAVLLYAQAVRETLSDGFDPTNGSEVTSRMWNRTFQGLSVLFLLYFYIMKFLFQLIAVESLGPMRQFLVFTTYFPPSS